MRVRNGVGFFDVTHDARLVGAAWLVGAVLVLFACGDHGVLPTTVERGPDLSLPDVVFDEGYYYCRVEPILFERRCGPGDPSQGDAASGCHASVTSFRLTEYAPLVAESCGGGIVPGVDIPPPAAQNYQTAQARMRRDPDQAPLLLYPTGQAQHPRTVIEANSAEADVIRAWATQYSTQ